MNEEEKQQLINEIVERLLLMIPDVIGNLITNHVSLVRMNKEFYDKFPEFRGKKDIVASVVEMIEGQDPTVDYKDILEKSVPEIRNRIERVKDLDLVSIKKPNRDLSNLFSDHGEL